ncbi:MAG: hypothetical protein FWD59_04075 [Micrococcales bacterium]|nr:hypothetical protein [Micrococcales bacterium]
MTTATLTRKKSLTIPEDLLAEAEERTGPRELSAYVTKALASQLEHDRLGDYLRETEATQGPISEAVMEQVHADLSAARKAREALR